VIRARDLSHVGTRATIRSGMRLDLGLNLRLSQQLRLAPQIIQSIEILQLPTMDLQELIENELQENEALEIVEPAAEPLPVVEKGPAREEDDGAVEDDAERVLDRLDALADAERGPRGAAGRAAAEEAGDRKLEAMQNTPAETQGLADHLMLQLEELVLAPEVRRAAEAIVGNLNDAGLLPCPLSEVLESMDDPVSEEIGIRALKVVQSLEPAGVGARDFAECLLLQVDDDDPDADLQRTLLRDHLEDLKRNKVPKVAKALGLEVGRVYEVLHRLKMTTRPGAGYAVGPVRYIRPDVVVDWEEGEYVVRLVHDYLPRVGISARIRQMLRESRQDPKIREYLKKKIDSAKWLIEAIAQRQNTLERVAKEIVRRQRDYLDFGVSHLRPLKMQEVADALGIHVSTVSRAISDKHAQTPRGIVPLKFFFTGGTESVDGALESRLSVKERVRDIVGGEDKQNPLSDDEVAERLSKEFGLAIARRTVTKYRKALGIPSSRQRRVWS
jgi:RNA polymerase sigma-54 factor